MASNTAYSATDRAIHKLAFGSPILQEILNDMEEALLRKSWSDLSAANPIFITSLPRAGTTVLLESLFRLPGLAAHTYRDMPLILTPVLWRKMAKVFYREGRQRERAHGDGLVISEDSPEAFEEVLWKKHFSKQYSADDIKLWPERKRDANDEEFCIFFREHMKKIILLRQGPGTVGGRYISKNNANISRTGFLKSCFPDATIIVPLRDPIEHAISLWRQHLNFLEQHAADDFTRRYMEDIGHYEFGVLHRPIRFPELGQLTHNLSPITLDYWVAYWISAFDYLSRRSEISFLCYESLCQSGFDAVWKLCQHLGIECSEQEVAHAASIFREPPGDRKASHKVADINLVENASQIYESLQKRCLLN